MRITVSALKKIIRETASDRFLSEEIVNDNVFVASAAIEKLRHVHTMLRDVKLSLRTALSSADVGDDEAGKYTETSREGLAEARQALMNAAGAVGDALTALEI